MQSKLSFRLSAPRHLPAVALTVALLVVVPFKELAAQSMKDGDCDAFLDVAGFQNVLDNSALYLAYVLGTPPGPQRFLYIKSVLGRDNGEAESREPADIGLVVYGGPDFKTVLNRVRLYGPIYNGRDDDGSEKYEWEDYCTVYYNNFIAANLTGYKYDCVQLVATEGDHQSKYPRLIRKIVNFFAHSALTDDIIFKATVCGLADARLDSELTVMGTCDIPGQCAELTIAIRDGSGGSPLEGCFWSRDDFRGRAVALLNEPCADSYLEHLIAANPSHVVREVRGGKAGDLINCQLPPTEGKYSDDLPILRGPGHRH